MTELSDEGEQELKFTVLIHYVSTIDIAGVGGIFVTEPKTRLVSISVRAEDCAHALDKPSKSDLLRQNEKVRLKITVTTSELRLNQKNYNAHKPSFEQTFRSMVEKDAELLKIVEDGGLLGYGRETCNIFAAHEE